MVISLLDPKILVDVLLIAISGTLICLLNKSEVD